MYCIKCGGMVHLDALSCFHCGITIDHTGNINTVQWHALEGNKKDKKKEESLFFETIPLSSLIKTAIWASLIMPALIMPYIFKLSFEKYRNLDSILLDAILSMIVFSVFYLVKKALYNSKHKR